MTLQQHKVKKGLLPAGAVLLAAGLFAAAGMGSSQSPPQQPIGFFHRVHCSERHIDCVFCHRTAETADFAGMPSVRLCMSCHRTIIPDSPEVWKLRSYWELGEPIQWERVNQLPAHVYFSHKAHVTTGKIDCSPCHGPVETMDQVQQTAPLTMGWCLQCHRQRKATTECVACHR